MDFRRGNAIERNTRSPWKGENWLIFFVPLPPPTHSSVPIFDFQIPRFTFGHGFSEGCGLFLRTCIRYRRLITNPRCGPKKHPYRWKTNIFTNLEFFDRNFSEIFGGGRRGDGVGISFSRFLYDCWKWRRIATKTGKIYVEKLNKVTKFAKVFLAKCWRL